MTYEDELWTWLQAKPTRTFTCENCEKIGPAKRSDKRYCSNVCRAQASRRRRAAKCA